MKPEEHAKVLDALEAITKHFSISRLHESTLADTTVRGQAHEAIAIMRKELQGWMPIETAPKDGKMILLHCDHGNFKYISCGNWVNHRGGYWTTDFAESVTPEELMAMQPTHWMPLPPPPGKEPEPQPCPNGEPCKHAGWCTEVYCQGIPVFRNQYKPEGWQPIETAPKDGTAIMLGARWGAWIGKYLPIYQSGYKPENPWSSLMLNHDHLSEKRYSPTHWMPLPTPPALLEKAR